MLMSKAKLGFCLFSDGNFATDIVAPKSICATKEDFLAECLTEYGEDYHDKWAGKIKLENITEAHCRYYPSGIEGMDWEGGCYSFGREGAGAFPVWRIDLQ
jgi:hypothetical protein